MAESKSIHEKRFEAAVSVIQSLPKNGSFQPSNEMMLKFYSYYKQATQGPCNIPRPGFWDPIGRYKWDAWSALGDTSKEEAMIAYVEEMKKIIESMPVTEKVEELLKILGPFYEIVEDNQRNATFGLSTELGNVLTSTPSNKTVNGKLESGDSGAESEEEEEDEGEDEAELEENRENIALNLKNTNSIDSAADLESDTVMTNGLDGHDIGLSALNDGEIVIHNHHKHEYLEETKQAVEPSEIHDAKKCTEVNEVFIEEEIAGIQHLTSDSDSEVYCDSMEQFAQEEISGTFSSGRALLNHSFQKDLLPHTTDSHCPDTGHLSCGFHNSQAVDGTLTLEGEVRHGGEDGKGQGSGSHRERFGRERSEFHGLRRGRGTRILPSGGNPQGVQTGSSGDGEQWGANSGTSGNLHEQIAATLLRLQEDMRGILQRLHTLEELTTSQTRSLHFQSDFQPGHFVKKRSWWPFEISPGALAFAVVWPFIVHWLIHVYRQRRQRK
ncbi:acyl-CoA-binding domain-containing protein 5 [Protopterus annectens]|uniref:acyl-CoA-binding domain-containing protein 5 n=1 Tax=Protopterus annectens TaxID=7888 RepID=UPI001CFA5337|nr:acyl-CoA-binding domain-containing protein 5 [Protopterus annectens]